MVMCHLETRMHSEKVILGDFITVWTSEYCISKGISDITKQYMIWGVCGLWFNGMLLNCT